MALMSNWGLKKQLLLPLAAVVAFLFTTGLVLADEAITPTLSLKGDAGNGGGGQTNSEESQSFLRKYTWENSFDKAGDATQNLSNSLKGGINYNCNQYRSDFTLDGKKFFASEDFARKCEQRQRAANSFRKEAESIKGQQRVFAEVSRVSDAAAVAAVGAVAYAELGQKKSGQQNSYLAAAKLQEVAGMAAYTTGAADVAMGGWSYLNHKSKLEKMQQTLNGKESGVSGSSGNAQLNGKLSSAIEHTKTAATNHMLWGAGKVAAGFASMKLAKRTRQQAEAMGSIEVPVYPTAAAPVVASGSGVGNAGTTQSNQPHFEATPEPTVSAAKADSGGGGPAIESTGSSAMNADFKGGAKREPASAGAGGGGGGFAAFSNASTEADAKEAIDEEKATQAEVAKSAFGYGEFARGGGGASFSGAPGAAPAGADEALGQPSNLAPGANEPGLSVASAINPNQMFDEATSGLEGNEQGSMAGVSGNRDRSLFDTIKLKHNKAFQLGNLQGPTAVEVRN